MSKTKHTPAPWHEIYDDGQFWISGPDFSEPVICDLLPRGQEFHEEDGANARLIAKAPELAASVRAMLGMMEHDHAEELAAEHHGDESCSYCDWMDNARALLKEIDA